MKPISKFRDKRMLLLIFSCVFSVACRDQAGETHVQSTRTEELRSEGSWYRGNLHTHSFWSDGDDFPESIIAWYVDQEYDFLAISDHNTLADSERWLQFHSSDARYDVYRKYVDRFGSDWVEFRDMGDSVRVRLKRFDEYSDMFSVEGLFLLIQAEEITDGYDGEPVHVNATNIIDFMEPQGGNSIYDVMQRNVNAVLKQREETGRYMFPHINHPNFGWAVTAHDMARLEGERFIEVYNGHPSVHNEGDGTRPSVEMMWDIANTIRVSEGRPLLYGLGVDDAHHFNKKGGNHANPGRGWVVVRSEALSADAIIRSMESGNFYASSGVELDAIEITKDGITLEIAEEEGVTYRTEFIGTRKQCGSGDYESQDKTDGPDCIGVVLHTVSGATAEYAFQNDELFVRARVVSSILKENPYRSGEYERAWTQPVIVWPANWQ